MLDDIMGGNDHDSKKSNGPKDGDMISTEKNNMTIL